MADDIRQWLEALGLGKYAKAFSSNDIDFRALPHLDRDDLKELGVSLGHRKLILAAIAEMKEPGATGPSPARLPTEEFAESTSTDPAPQQVERRQLTVMFCDLVGSTALSARLDPEELRDVLREYQDAVTGVVQRYGGHIAKYLGDGVLTYFGWPQAYEDQAERAVRAGLGTVDAVSAEATAGGIALQARVGIATGEVVVGDLVGARGRDAEAVIGETPNLAARLQALASPGEVVIGDLTQRLIGRTFELEDLGVHQLKGFSDPLPAWRVCTERQFDSRFDAARGIYLAGLIGRETELRLLEDRWRLASGGEGQVVLISGEPGIGKSRLMRALSDGLPDESVVRLRYQCSPYHMNSALYPVIQQIGRAAGFGPDDSDTDRLDKLEKLIDSGSPDLPENVRLFADLLSIPYQHRHGAMTISTQRHKKRIHQALVDQLLALEKTSPVLILFEDAHWIDPTTGELLEEIVSWISDTRIMLLITHRPEWHAPFAGQPHTGAIALSRLGRGSVSEIVFAIAGDEIDESLVRQIVERTDGVPLFAEELTRAATEAASRADEIPTTLQASLLARLDRLGDAKEVVQIGAAMGREFSFASLADVTGIDPPDLGDMLERVVGTGLVFCRGTPPDAVYVFKHALVQDAAYESLLISRRRKLHARIAEALESCHPELVEFEPEVMAHHYTQAGLTRQASDYWRRAGAAAVNRSATVEAGAQFSKALDLVRELPDDLERDHRELDLLLELGPQLMLARGIVSREVETAYERARELSARLGEPRQRFMALWGLWHMNEFRAEWKVALGLADELIEIAEGENDVELSLQAHHAQWSTLLFLGELGPARDHSATGWALYDERKHGHHGSVFGGHDPGVCALQLHATAQACLGQPGKALDSITEGIALAERLQGPSNRAMMYFFAGLIHQILGQPEPAAAYAEKAVRVGEAYDILPYVQMARILRGWAVAARGDFEEGLAELNELLDAARVKRRKRGLLPLYLGLLADACLRAGKLELGNAAVADAFERVADQDEHLWESELHRLKATCLLRDGQAAAGEAALQQAIEIARKQGTRTFELRASIDLARIWMERNERAEARALLEPVYSDFPKDVVFVDLVNAGNLLSAL